MRRRSRRIFALVAAEGGEKRREVGIAGVVPVELHVVALDHAGGDTGGEVGVIDEQGMRTGQTGRCGQRRQLLRHRKTCGRVTCADPRSGARRERDRIDQLRVVRVADAPAGIRPGEVEHELAIGMRFQVQRRDRGDSAVIGEHCVTRRPAEFRADAAMAFQRRQKGMTRKRVARRKQGIPLRSRDRGSTLDMPDAHGATDGQRQRERTPVSETSVLRLPRRAVPTGRRCRVRSARSFLRPMAVRLRPAGRPSRT